MAGRLLIVGASVRAAAASASRSGFEVVAIDGFGDRDVVSVAPVCVSRRYPRDLATLAGEVAAGEWMYCGGLENYPRLIGEISSRHALLGMDGATVRGVRDPWRVAEALEQAGLRFLRVRKRVEFGAAEGWIAKRLCSTAGSGVAWADPTDLGAQEGRYFQEYVEGAAVAAVFLAVEGGGARLLGVTRQLVGRAQGAAREFQYAGSIGPVRLESAVGREVARMGRVLTRELGMRGLFAVDGVLDVAGKFWPVEINPRYSASMEVLERAGESHAKGMVKMHVAACRREGEDDAALDEVAAPGGESRRSYGKLIVFAESAGEVTKSLSDAWYARSQRGTWPTMGDIPQAGTRVEAGHPVATVFAEGAEGDEVSSRLAEERAAVLAELRTGRAAR